MILSKAVKALLVGTTAFVGIVSADEDGFEAAKVNTLPFIGDLIERAYPTWCIDEDENRLYDVEVCEDGTPNGRWSPLYFTKQYSGADPALGGYPSNIDIKYPFEFAAPFLGQACAGTPHMCSEDFDGTATNCKKCPKLNTKTDNGLFGPGHIPPHISLAAMTWAYEQGKGGDVADWFDFEAEACRILPHKLLQLVRIYYPREEDGTVYYPPPFSDAGGAYPLEFVNLAGETCENEKAKHPDAGFLDCYENHSGNVSDFPEYLEVGHGSPHFCTKAGKAADVNPDYCPYIFFGPNRGKYRHPHIALSALETYLANLVMPTKCGTTWDDSNYPPKYDTTTAFPYMEDMVALDNGLAAPQQPTIDTAGHWIWPGPEGIKKKPVEGLFATSLYTVPEDKPILIAPSVELYGEENCKTIGEIICSHNDYNGFCNAMEKFSGLTKDLTFDTEGRWTLFVPLGDDLGVDGLTDDQLMKFIRYHMMDEAKLTTELPCETGQNLIGMSSGKDVRVKCTKEATCPFGVKGGGNNMPMVFSDTDIIACNGVIHEIHAPLIAKD